MINRHREEPPTESTRGNYQVQVNISVTPFSGELLKEYISLSDISKEEIFALFQALSFL